MFLYKLILSGLMLSFVCSVCDIVLVGFVMRRLDHWLPTWEMAVLGGDKFCIVFPNGCLGWYLRVNRVSF